MNRHASRVNERPMHILMQLYSARNEPSSERVLEQVAALGYTGVEGFRTAYDDPAAYRAALDRNGLTMPSAHLEPDLLESDFGRASDIARTLGVKTMICPFVALERRPTDRAGWISLGERLGAIGEKATAAGYRFGWHNHHFEFSPLEGGAMPLDILLSAAPAIDWQADLGWLARARQDPLAWIAKYGRRITSIHLKDLQMGGSQGSSDWAAVMRALAAQAAVDTFVAEHDNPASFRVFAEEWIAGFRALQERADGRINASMTIVRTGL